MNQFHFFSIFLMFHFSFGQGLVSEWNIQGNKKTRTALIKKISNLKTGEPLDSTIIQQDIARLIRLPAVSHAYFQVSKIGEDQSYQVVYGVEENFTLIPFANIFTSYNNEFAFRIGLQEFNFLGQNVTLGAFYQNDIFDSFGLNVRVPYLFSKKTGMALNFQDLTTLEPVFLDNGTASYRYNNTSIELLGIHEINYKNRVELGISFFNEDYRYLSGATAAGVPQNLVVDKYLTKFLYNYDGVHYYYYYLDGFRSNLNMQRVTSTDNQLPDFWLGFNDLSYFKRVGKKGNWASRLRLGLASNIDTPFAPFAVDNNLNIRGVGNLIDRGTGAIVLNTEYRYSLIEKDWFVLQGNVFVDGGSWRNPGGDFSDFSDDQNIRIYPGVGIRFIHKYIFNAILRIDYGHGITQNPMGGFVFGIGQYF